MGSPRTEYIDVERRDRCRWNRYRQKETGADTREQVQAEGDMYKHISKNKG